MRKFISQLSSATAALAITAAGTAGLTVRSQAQESIVSVCSGVSLPRSVVTDLLRPVLNGVVQPLENTVNGLLGPLDPLLGILLPGPVNTDVSGLLDDAAAGNPIGLSVLDVDGTVVGPSDDCVATADGIRLNEEAGIAIGGNRVSGLGQNGEDAQAGQIDAIALGNGASTSASAAGAIALGHDAGVGAGATGAVAIGDGASAATANSVALGAGSVADADLAAPAYNPGAITLDGAAAVGEVSFGDAGAERRLTNIAAGSADTDGANIAQLKSLDAKFTEMSSWAIRYDTATRDVATLAGAGGTRLTNLQAGALTAASSDAVNGSQLYATNQALAELSSLAVTYDTDGSGNRTNSVTMRGSDPDEPVRVRNVARGEAATDAVNKEQLDDGLEQTRTYVRSVQTDSFARSKAYTDQKVDEVRGEARQAAAIGLAAASLRFDDSPGKFSVGASGGVWRGEAAFAAGFGYTSETGRVRANATATTAGGAWGAGGGVSLTLN